MKRKGEMVLLDNKTIEKIEVVRLADGGFQRKLRDKRINQMAKQLGSNGTVSPPILIAKVEGRLILIDGQHRLEARKRRQFPQHALIVPMTMKQAAENFVVSNGTAMRVGLRHRLEVDPRPFATRLRAIANAVGIDAQRVYNFLLGLTSRRCQSNQQVTAAQWNVTRKVLEAWTADKRMKASASYYAKPGVFQMLGHMVKDAKQPLKVVRALQRINFNCSGPLRGKYGNSGVPQAMMRSYAYRFCHRELGGAKR